MAKEVAYEESGALTVCPCCAKPTDSATKRFACSDCWRRVDEDTQVSLVIRENRVGRRHMYDLGVRLRAEGKLPPLTPAEKRYGIWQTGADTVNGGTWVKRSGKTADAYDSLDGAAFSAALLERTTSKYRYEARALDEASKVAAADTKPSLLDRLRSTAPPAIRCSECGGAAATGLDVGGKPSCGRVVCREKAETPDPVFGHDRGEIVRNAVGDSLDFEPIYDRAELVAAIARASFNLDLRPEAERIAEPTVSGKFATDRILDKMWAETKPTKRKEAEAFAERLVAEMGRKKP